MVKKIGVFLVLLFCVVTSFAQNIVVKGVLKDADTKEGLVQATVQLLRSDSTFVGGSISDEQGLFQLSAPSEGKYLIKISNIGYLSHYQKIDVSGKDTIDVGSIVMKSDAVMLKGAVVTRRATKVVLKEDTFIYNASAYKTPEGATLEELVKRLPGATIGDDGKITINGKEVTKILIDGKEFMTGDTKTAMKNLPVSIVDKIKSYDTKSDLAKATGMDDGEDQTVLDFGIKQGMNKGLFGNVDLGIGTKNRYAERLMGALFKDDLRVMMLGAANNTNDMGFPGGGGRGGFGRNNNGLNALKMVGANVNYEKKDRILIDGSLRWNHSNADIASIVSSENFVGSTSSYSNSISNLYKRGNEWNARMRVEWHPDSMTTITMRPELSLTTSDQLQKSNSAVFNTDPYSYGSDPLSSSVLSAMATNGAVVNTQSENTIAYTDNQAFSLKLQGTRKLNTSGRSITLETKFSTSKTDANQLAMSNVHLYQVANSLGQDSTYQVNRYMVSPERSNSYSVKMIYSEPIARRVYLQFGYKFGYGVNKGDRQIYDFSNLGETFFSGLQPSYRRWDSYLSTLPNAYSTYKDDALSRTSRYESYTHDIELGLKVTRKAYQLSAGVMLEPQKTHFIQSYLNVNTDTVRTVLNFSPTFELNYKFSDVSKLKLTYRGKTSQPTITQLLDIRDNSNPLNIYQGNSGLKPAFVNSLRLFYNNYIEKKQRSMMAHINFSSTRNAISNKVEYDTQTGGMLTRPINVNGNWNASGAFMFNTAIDSLGYFNFNSFSNVNYNNYVSYLALSAGTSALKNITRALTLSERASFGYRNSWIEVELNGTVDYSRSTNTLKVGNSNLNTWQFSYGTNVTFMAPWNMQITTGLTQNSRRGFSDKSMNTNELVWNAQVSQSFLKSKSLTVSLQLYDILHNLSSVSRTIDALKRSDTSYNTINSYAMLHVIYNVNLFGGKENRDKMRPNGGPEGQEGMPPMPQGRGNRGGFGGGMPPR
ncbi:TonB-dependent receptor [Hoylesella nanceiensis]|uniref:TonB-dependent receptor n=1 Tax=Hoylesella nanceiensis TaxID=425941 RepID=UPI001CAF5EF3|nr:TonB-dependent receptor [Hoylesella nanceiensis]MBF1428589.1 TonB-dependent receptor [Hoylesella nanceiensis]MBF1440602.1 TonB-dependent receptor [Hoylesella nanceiensis]